MSILPVGGIQIGDKIKLLSSKKVESLIFSNPDITDRLMENLTSEQAQECLSTFGKYAKNVTMDPEHLYEFLAVHGTSQLYDNTVKKPIIQGVIKLSHPITTLLKNIFERLIKK